MNVSIKTNHTVCILSGILILCGLIATTAHAQERIGNSGMFISIRDAYLGDNIFPTPIEGLKHLGLTAIEVSLARDFSVHALDSKDTLYLKTDTDVKAYGEKAKQLGVNICALLTACDFSSGDQEANIAFITRAIEIADLLGASAIRIDSSMKKERELNFEERVNLFVEGLSGALKRTPNSKVALGIENHGFQGNNLCFLLNVFQQTGSDRLGSTLDLGNFYWRGYPLSEVYGILRILAPYAKHTHMKNIHYPTEQREVTREVGWEYNKYNCPFDEGDIDLSKVAAMLAKTDYKADICIEDESVGKMTTPEERASVLQRDVAYIRKSLESLK